MIRNADDHRRTATHRTIGVRQRNVITPFDAACGEVRAGAMPVDTMFSGVKAIDVLARIDTIDQRRRIDVRR